MIERGPHITELFTYLPQAKAKILARGLAFAETTHGCSCACRICFIPAPVNVKRYIPSQTISAIHDFIGKYDRTETDFFSHHEAGQLSDYHDPQTGWDMADVVGDCLTKTQRKISLYLHGIDGKDDRAINAAKKLLNLPPEMKDRVFVTISTDPFGPMNVPVEEAEATGRERSLNALRIFEGWPHMELRIFTPDLKKDGVAEERRVRALFGDFVPGEVEVMQIQRPTRVSLPGVDHHAYMEMCNGYGIHANGDVVFKRFAGPRDWPVIGSLTSLDPARIEPVSYMVL